MEKFIVMYIEPDTRDLIKILLVDGEDIDSIYEAYEHNLYTTLVFPIKKFEKLCKEVQDV